MEKIKEALAKAKLESKAAPQVPASKPSPVLDSSVPFENTENELGKIVYNDTTVVKLDPRHLEKNRIWAHIKNNAITGVFDSLRTQILQKMEENGWQTLAIISPTPECGKTMLSINLAMSIAQQPQKTTVLVDFDLRRPRVASYLGLQVNKSLSDYLVGRAAMHEVMYNPDMPRLVVMPTMKPVSRSSELLSSSKVTELIKDLKDRYDSRIIIFDLPPILSSDDAMVLLPQVDCVLLVVANGMCTQAQIEQTMYHLSGHNLLGAVFNRGEAEASTYYY